jgi:hypothetical protein
MNLDVFFDVLTGVFGFDYGTYLREEGRGFCGFRIAGAAAAPELLLHLGMERHDADALLIAVTQRGLPQALGGYYTPALDPVPDLRLNHDMLFISDDWHNAMQKQKFGTAYHEACHCFRESRCFTPYPELSAPLTQGRIVRAYTQYQFDPGIGHDDQWFALLAGAAKQMQLRHPQVFANAREVVEMGLTKDWGQEPMNDVDWAPLEACQ